MRLLAFIVVAAWDAVMAILAIDALRNDGGLGLIALGLLGVTVVLHLAVWRK